MGTRKNRLGEAVLTSTHNLCFEQKYEKYQRLFIWKFSVFEVKFSTYLNRHVFVMRSYAKCAFRSSSAAPQSHHSFYIQLYSTVLIDYVSGK